MGNIFSCFFLKKTSTETPQNKKEKEPEILTDPEILVHLHDLAVSVINFDRCRVLYFKDTDQTQLAWEIETDHKINIDFILGYCVVSFQETMRLRFYKKFVWGGLIDGNGMIAKILSRLRQESKEDDAEDDGHPSEWFEVEAVKVIIPLANIRLYRFVNRDEESAIIAAMQEYKNPISFEN